MPVLGQTDEHDIEGEWWRADGEAQLAETAPPEHFPPVMGLDEGFRNLVATEDALAGSSATRPARGTVRFRPTRGARLALIDASACVFDELESRYAMLGRDLQGRPISLLDCFGLPGSYTRTGLASMEAVGDVLVLGAHVTAAEQLRFREIALTIIGLTELLEFGGLRTEQSPVEVRLPAGRMQIELRQRDATHPVEPRLGQIRRSTIRIDSGEPLTYARWQEEWITPLLAFTRFATREPAAVESVTGSSPRSEASRVEVLQPRADLIERGAPHGYRRMLGAALPSDMQLVLKRWWELYGRLDRALPLLFAVVHSRGYADAQLVTLTSIAEAYQREQAKPSGEAGPLDDDEHERHTAAMLATLPMDAPEAREIYGRALGYANRYTQRVRIRTLIARAGEVVEAFGRDGRRLADRLTDTRNELVHLDEVGGPTLRGLDLVEAKDLLVLVLETNLLLDLGFTPAQALERLSYSYGSQPLWLRLLGRGTAWPRRSTSV